MSDLTMVESCLLADIADRQKAADEALDGFEVRCTVLVITEAQLVDQCTRGVQEHPLAISE